MTLISPNTSLRVCKSCEQEKPLEAFPFSAANLWRRHVCSICYSREQGPKAAEHYAKNKEAILAKRKLLRAERKAAGLKNPPRFRQDNATYVAGHRAADARRLDALRTATFEAYGGVACACCGEREPLFLSLDHIDGNGNQHRKATGTRGGHKFYKLLQSRGYPPGYQVLCMNCNCGRHRNGGKCPHQKS